MLLTAGVLALVVGMLLAQQGGGGGGTAAGGAQAGPAGGGTRADAAAREQQRMNDLLLSAGLTAAERTAVEPAAKAKLEARQQLMTALTDLRAASEDTAATDAKLKQAIATYQKAAAKYRSQVEAQDKAMVAKLSVRSQARCLALGIIDNGLGMSFRRAGGGGGGMRGGGGGGGGMGGGR
jgi:hypothetical protein